MIARRFREKASPQAAFAITSAVIMVLALYAVFFVAPLDQTLGISQKIFYFHVSSAFHMMGLFAVCGLCGVYYLLASGKQNKYVVFADAIGIAAAEVGVVLGAGVLISGSMWARKAWGTWWTWEPRLTLALLVFLLFVSYLALRGFVGTDRFGTSVASGFALTGFPALYFMHVAVERFGGAHPQVVFRGGIEDPAMKAAFWASILAIGAVSLSMVSVRFSMELLKRELDSLYLETDRSSCSVGVNDELGKGSA